MKLKILHVSRNIPIKSIEGNRVILDILININSYDVEQKILFPAEYIPKGIFKSSRLIAFSELVGECSVDGIDVLFYKFFRFLKGKDFILSSLCLNNSNVDKYCSSADILHAHYIMPDGFIANKLAKKINKPYVVSVRQGDIDRLRLIEHGCLYESMYYKVLKQASAVISINHSIASYLFERFSVHSYTLPHGVPSEIISKKKKVVSKTLQVVTCAQLIDRKNIDWIINSFLDLSSEYDIELTIIGAGPLEKKLTPYFGLPGINYLGSLSKDNVMNVFSSSDVFVLPSDNETFGMVYIEAAAKGCLIIGKKDTGVDGYFKNNYDALFVSEQDELTFLLKKILTNKIDWRKKAEKGQENVRNNFTWDVIKKQYMAIYEQVSK